MKHSIIAVAAATLLMAAPAMAQSNATIQGTQTAPSNGQGTPNAASPTGQLGTTTVVPGASTGTPAGNIAAGQPTMTGTSTNPNGPASTSTAK